MGLEDILPDDSETSSSSSSRRNSSSSDDEDLVTIGSGADQKQFSEERWEEVKKVIREEMEYSVNEVKHLPSSKRYEVLHQAATWDGDELTEEQEELKSDTNCLVCGRNCSRSGVELEGEHFCTDHPAIMVRRNLDNA